MTKLLNKHWHHLPESKVIDLVDVKKHQLIWYGAGTKALRKNPKHVEREINDAVTRIFYRYKWMAGRADPVRTIQR